MKKSSAFRLEIKTPNDGGGHYFVNQNHTAREWLGIVARYETGTFPDGSQFIAVHHLGDFANEQITNKFIAGQIAVYKEAGELVLNSQKTVKNNRPVLALVEA
jgi:hypothetical protein